MKNKINAHENILSLIGNTPLIKLNKVTKSFDGDYYAKYEAMNPGQSNKDRIALHIIESAEKKGLIDKNSTIIETTSGNTCGKPSRGLGAGPGNLRIHGLCLKPSEI